MIYITRFTLLILVLFISQSFAQVQGPAVNSYYESGIELLKQRDYESAEKQFKKSIDLHADAPSMYQLAKILAEQNTIQSRERARELLKKAIWKEPKNTEYRFLLASLIEKFSLRMALDEYEKITRIDSTSAVAWYNLGRLKEKDFNEYHNSIFLDNVDSPPLSYEQFAMADFKEAETYFIKALRFDSLNLQTYLHLSFLYEDVDSSAKGIPLLKKMVRLYPDNEDAHLYLGLLYYKTSNIALAFREYQAALKLMTYDQEMDFTFKSVKSLLEPVLDEQFKKYSDDELKDLIELYWKVNDPLELTQYNERLLEHYSRVAYANLRFGNSKNKIPGWQTDKGEVVLRYGEPLHRLRYRPHINAGGRTEVMVKTDVWQYRDMTLGFTDEYMSGNYRFSVPSPGSRYITQFPGDTQMLMDYLRKARFENYEPRYEGPSFETPYEIVQFKDLDDSKGNKTSVYVNYALSIPDSIIRGRKLSYAHDLGLFYKDRNFDNIFAKKDSVKTLGGSNRITTSTGDELYVNSIDMTVPPDSGILSFEIVRKIDNGVSSNHISFKTRGFNGQSLVMSDIMLAANVKFDNFSIGPIQRKNISITPNPTKVFSKKQDLYIYYEVYNLQLDGQMSTDMEQRITLKRADQKSGIGKIVNSFLGFIGLGRSTDEVSLSSRYQTHDKDSQMYLQLDLSKYEPGDYLINITVKDNLSGKETSAETPISWR